MIKNKRQMFSVIGVFTLIMLLGTVSYAFFNYTRTGEANTFRTGNIYFNAQQGQALNITNAFPMTSIEAGNASLDTVTLGILGDTTYADGEEFEITLVDVNNTINNKEIPVNYIATYTANTGGTIGTSNSDYWEDREDKDASIYILNGEGQVSEGKQVLVGYIDNGATGINGTLSISAYIDADRIAISDTYNGPESTPNANNGTTSEWVNGRTVLTTTEWNSISSNPISFKIKAESNEGIWANPQIESCIGCKFIYTTNQYFYSANNYASSPTSTLTTFENNNETLTDNYLTLNKNIFLGFKFDGSGNVTNAHACGIKGEEPNNGIAFCIEGALSDTYGGNSKKRNDIRNANSVILESLYGLYDDVTGVGCHNTEYSFFCTGGVVFPSTSSGGYAYTALSANGSICNVFNYGGANCD